MAAGTIRHRAPRESSRVESGPGGWNVTGTGSDTSRDAADSGGRGDSGADGGVRVEEYEQLVGASSLGRLVDSLDQVREIKGCRHVGGRNFQGLPAAAILKKDVLTLDHDEYDQRICGRRFLSKEDEVRFYSQPLFRGHFFSVENRRLILLSSSLGHCGSCRTYSYCYTLSRSLGFCLLLL